MRNRAVNIEKDAHCFFPAPCNAPTMWPQPTSRIGNAQRRSGVRTQRAYGATSRQTFGVGDAGPIHRGEPVFLLVVAPPLSGDRRVRPARVQYRYRATE